MDAPISDGEEMHVHITLDDGFLRMGVSDDQLQWEISAKKGERKSNLTIDRAQQRMNAVEHIAMQMDHIRTHLDILKEFAKEESAKLDDAIERSTKMEEFAVFMSRGALERATRIAHFIMNIYALLRYWSTLDARMTSTLRKLELNEKKIGNIRSIVNQIHDEYCSALHPLREGGRVSHALTETETLLGKLSVQYLRFQEIVGNQLKLRRQFLEALHPRRSDENGG